MCRVGQVECAIAGVCRPDLETKGFGVRYPLGLEGVNISLSAESERKNCHRGISVQIHTAAGMLRDLSFMSTSGSRALNERTFCEDRCTLLFSFCIVIPRLHLQGRGEKK